jgi:plasmid stability protein
MKNLQIKNVPPDVHEALRKRARNEGMTMSDYLLDLIKRDLERPTMREWFELVKSREPIDIDGAQAVNEARAEREAELDAALRS